MHTHIIYTLNFQIRNSGKNNSCMVSIDILQLEEAKLKLNLTFVQHFIQFVLTNNKNLYSLWCFETQNLHSI